MSNVDSLTPAISSKDIESILNRARAAAESKRSGAGYNGEWGDGGAQALETLINAWEAGLSWKIPKELETYYQDHIRATDPDYAMYLKLKEKFE